MTSDSKVYIAGVGYSPSSSEGSSTNSAVASLISAATKALLDAGVTYDDVDKGVKGSAGKGSNHMSEAFKAFDQDGITIKEAKFGSELGTSLDLIQKKGAQCVLMIAEEDSAAVAMVLVSYKFLMRRPYLKDSSATIRKSETSNSKSGGNEKKVLYNICQKVWSLRGWSNSKGKGEDKSNQGFELSRADGNDVPEWKDVEHKQDGKFRLGYNPAKETKEISREDFEAVRAFRKEQKEVKSLSGFKRKGGDGAALARL